VVGQLVATMGSIKESSRKIADIIGVIDGVVFQTNIRAQKIISGKRFKVRMGIADSACRQTGSSGYPHGGSQVDDVKR